MTNLVTRRTLLGGLALVAAAPPLTREQTPMSLEDLEAGTERAAASYMSGTADLPTLIDHVRRLLGEAAQYERGPRSRDALHVQAWQAALLGALSAGQGNIPRAKAYALIARQFGERAGDAQAVARAHIAAAQVELWPGGDPAKARQIASDGLSRTSSRYREQYARLAALLMEGHAKTGDPAAIRESVTIARRAHAYLDAKPSTLFGFSAQQMHAAMAMALADAGDRSAVHHAEMSIIRYPQDAPAVRILAEYPKAYALGRTGSPDDAVGVALAAITSSSTPSWLEKDRARWVLGGLPEGYTSAPARHLQELANAV